MIILLKSSVGPT